MVTVAAVLVFVGFRALTSEKPTTPVRAVDYLEVAAGARAENELRVLAPDRLPVGWRATSATYDRGPSPAWHLGLLTEDSRYVGVEESRSAPEALVEEHVDPDAVEDGPVRIAGQRWQGWRDAGGDYAVVTRIPGPGGAETLLVVGSGPRDDVRELAASLLE